METKLTGLALLLLCAGCVTTDKRARTENAPANMPAPPAAAQQQNPAWSANSAARQLVATWSNKVTLAPDPTRNGAPNPGFVGRVYIFGAEPGAPLTGDGSITVDLFDDTHAATGPQGAVAQQSPIEEWQIDRDTMKKLLKKDLVGMGYTVFLPWGTYRPDITKVHLNVRYTPAQGTPLYSNSPPMTMDHGDMTAAVNVSPQTSQRTETIKTGR